MNNKNLPEEITIHNRLLNRMSGGKVTCKETMGDVQLYNCGIAEGQAACGDKGGRHGTEPTFLGCAKHRS